MSASKKPSLVSNAELQTLPPRPSIRAPQSGANTIDNADGNASRPIGVEATMPSASDYGRQKAGLPNWSIDDIQRAVRAYDRSPFQDLLAVFADACPPPDALASWAQKFPDRYAGAISALSRVAGFSERRELSVSHSDARSLSDSQLEDRLIAIAAFAGIPSHRLLEAVDAVLKEGSIIDAKAVEIEDSPDVPKNYADFMDSTPSEDEQQ